MFIYLYLFTDTGESKKSFFFLNRSEKNKLKNYISLSHGFDRKRKNKLDQCVTVLKKECRSMVYILLCFLNRKNYIYRFDFQKAKFFNFPRYKKKINIKEK